MQKVEEPLFDKLKKEAFDYAEEHKMDLIDYHDSSFMEDAYVASAMPREKRIAELEIQIVKIKECANCPMWLQNQAEENCKKLQE